ncbi:pectate lyase family protein [Thermogemmatispora onikobensis]|uniref:pectate lyase family protein n=1 Tax=Thermogemmatispora onikobensis TaxID=732234 RepID=UPI0008537B46|nr:cellulose binding domain-containing protein [Thermogemmatispora onikobensis]
MKRIGSRKLLWVIVLTLLVLVGGGLALIPVFLGTHTAAAAPVDQLVGYGAGTTGGAGGSVTTVSTLSALQNAVKGSSPKIVYVSGTITGDTDVDVGSNTSIIGVGSTASLVGISLSLKDVSNVIIRNLSISFVRADGNTSGDAIHIEHSQHVWVDHNNLFSDMDHGKDYYDGLVDITHASDYITVSWNRLHDHYKVSLVGHSDSNASEDTGHLHVTYHHNWFYSVNSRLPSLRFGTGHIYNNYYQNVDGSAIHSRMGAQVLVENNVFRNVDVALTTTGDSPQDGFANARGNDYGGATVDITQVGTFTTAPYNYTLDPVSDLINEVTTYSGVGIVSGNGSSGGATPTPTPTASATRTPTPTPTAAATRTPTPTPTASAGTSCRVSYTVTAQWPGGFTASLTITNTGTTAWNGWRLTFTFPSGQAVTQGWNGTFSQSGSTVTVTNASYNGSVAAGASVSPAPGFNGTWTTANANPTSFSVNGVSCSLA